MSTISVIVPVYNAGAFLAPLVQSILGQQVEAELQLILSDDGSRDGSLEVIRTLAKTDSRITVVTGPNGGVSAARNRALKAARGEYIGFADADDILEPGYFSTLLGLLERHGTQCAVCGFTRIYEASGVQDQLPVSGALQVTDRDGFRRLLLEPTGYTTVVWNKLFRREALQDERGQWIPFDEGLHIVEDGEYLFRSRVERAVFTPEPLYRYTVRTDGAMYGRLTDRKKTELTARRKIVELCRNSAPEVLALAEMKYQKGVRDLLFHAVIAGQGGEIQELLPELRIYRKALFESPALSKKEKLKYRIYGPMIRMNLRRPGAFLMKHLSGHG